MAVNQPPHFDLGFGRAFKRLLQWAGELCYPFDWGVGNLEQM